MLPYSVYIIFISGDESRAYHADQSCLWTISWAGSHPYVQMRIMVLAAHYRSHCSGRPRHLIWLTKSL